MEWITLTDLDIWSRSNAGRDNFPGLVGDLIRASVSDISEFRFPRGAAGQIRGFDGELECEVGAAPYVPSGRSIWEFGAGSNSRKKFTADFKKRAAEIAEAQRKELAFVFATPHKWDNARKKLPDFVEDHAKLKEFKSVHFIDGAKLIEWINSKAAVGARYARQILNRVPQLGARDTDEFWREFSHRYNPRLTEDVVLAARGQQAEQIVRHLMNKSGTLTFISDGLDEVSAVAVAAIRRANDDERKYLEARTLVIDTEEAGRQLAVPNAYGFIVSPPAAQIAGSLREYGPTISRIGWDSVKKGYERLERPSTKEMTDALLTMGLDDKGAGLLAAKSGRSLTILERHAAAAAYVPPVWIVDGGKLITALLAGGWDSRHPGDKEVLAMIAQTDYAAVETTLRPFLNTSDAPIERDAGIWKLRAPLDALLHLRNFVGPEHLVRLREAAHAVFATSAPPDLSLEIVGRPNGSHSNFLREGLANTLLMISALQNEIDLDLGGTDASEFVGDLVSSLPGLIDDERVILSLEGQLPLLMEAAPDPLLSALERLLEGKGADASAIFTEIGGYGLARKGANDLLWALEMIAWDPAYLERAAMILGRLATVDPGGRSLNRPTGSLREIFLSWHPGTNASLAKRLQVVDRLRSSYPKVSWTLLTQLLPTPHDVARPTAKPRYSDAGQSFAEVLTAGKADESYLAFIDRATEDAGTDPARWIQLVEHFPRFGPRRRLAFLEMLEHASSSFGEGDKRKLHEVLARLAARHKRFSSAAWALPLSEMDQLDKFVASLESDDPVERTRALYGIERHLLKPGSEEERRSAESRYASLRRLASRGAMMLLSLARSVTRQYYVAIDVAQTVTDDTLLEQILLGAIDAPDLQDFATTLAGALRGVRGQAFDEWIAGFGLRNGLQADALAGLLLNWPEEPSTWDLLNGLGGDVSRSFWHRRRPRPFSGSLVEFERLAGLYLSASRPSAAIESVHQRANELSLPLLIDIISRRIEIGTSPDDADDMERYYLQEMFNGLRSRGDLAATEIATWELALLPFLQDSDYRLAIHEAMATDAAFFVSVIVLVFRADDEEQPKGPPPTDAQRERSKAAFKVYMSFDRCPGETDGAVDAEKLDRWIDDVRREASSANRVGIIDHTIGKALAHSAELDGVWPQDPVAAAIERLSSSALEESIKSERFNMRGVFSKSFYEGGRQERELAERYRGWSARASTRPRTQAMVLAIAKNWENEANRSDDDAARDRLRFE
ncbi:hypothetical protein ACC697_04405 [Rhizobium ruizarguesonis]|uniref:hypothetical protein n=1 Tax=Rhizobium ruizarguesonis TaxID=2081791 RepID=UPI00163A1A16|nr:hypothetical protein [Rhizobium ruizarguesonis]MBC2804846.1 hypothetical protein [Rhizobium ruizarguesonis]